MATFNGAMRNGVVDNLGAYSAFMQSALAVVQFDGSPTIAEIDLSVTLSANESVVGFTFAPPFAIAGSYYPSLSWTAHPDLVVSELSLSDPIISLTAENTSASPIDIVIKYTALLYDQRPNYSS